MLLRVDTPIAPNTELDMIVELPAVSGEAPVNVICSGRVVRTREAAERAPGAMVAATIAHYRFHRT